MSDFLCVAGWVLGCAIWLRLIFKSRKVDPALAELRRCNREIARAMECGDLEAAQRWMDRFDEIHEYVKPMVDRWP